MKFTTTALASAMLPAVFGAIHTEQRWARHAERELSRQSKPKVLDGEITNDSHVQYSQNWAGAVLVGTGYTSVTGTITVPAASGGANAAASAWVGIDGDTCSSAILQTGIDFYGDGTFDAWYEWYPHVAFDFSLDVSEGDEITMTVTATSKTSGTAVIENNTTGKKVSKTFTGESIGSLCETNAEWIVEDFESGGSLVSFADFGKVTFTDASATQNGKSVGLTGATTMDIRQSGQVLTSCSNTASTMTCTYEG